MAERFGSIPAEMWERARPIFIEISGRVPARAMRRVRLIDLRTRYRFHREMEQVARRLRVDWRWVMLAAVSYDLSVMHMGCSTAALPTEEGPLLARNMDWWPEDKLAAASCVLRYVSGGQMRFAMAAWPGAAGVVSGISSRGFALALNAVLSEQRYCRFGWPVLLLLRRVLEKARDFDHAVRMICRPKLLSGALVTVVGRTNEQRVVIERTPLRAAQRWANASAPLIATNHYQLLSEEARRWMSPEALLAFDIPSTRCQRLQGLCEQIMAAGTPTSEAMLYALTDQGVVQNITAQHVILQPASQRVELFVPRKHLVSVE